MTTPDLIEAVRDDIFNIWHTSTCPRCGEKLDTAPDGVKLCFNGACGFVAMQKLTKKDTTVFRFTYTK